nr:allatotropin [Manduca sexta]
GFKNVEMMTARGF